MKLRLYGRFVSISLAKFLNLTTQYFSLPRREAIRAVPRGETLSSCQVEICIAYSQISPRPRFLTNRRADSTFRSGLVHFESLRAAKYFNEHVREKKREEEGSEAGKVQVTTETKVAGTKRKTNGKTFGLGLIKGKYVTVETCRG